MLTSKKWQRQLTIQEIDRVIQEIDRELKSRFDYKGLPQPKINQQSKSEKDG